MSDYNKNMIFEDHPYNDYEKLLEKQEDPKDGYNTIEKLANSTDGPDLNEALGCKLIIFTNDQDPSMYTADYTYNEYLADISSGTFVVFALYNPGVPRPYSFEYPSGCSSVDGGYEIYCVGFATNINNPPILTMGDSRTTMTALESVFIDADGDSGLVYTVPIVIAPGGPGDLL